MSTHNIYFCGEIRTISVLFGIFKEASCSKVVVPILFVLYITFRPLAAELILFHPVLPCSGVCFVRFNNLIISFGGEGSRHEVVVWLYVLLLAVLDL